MTGFQIWLVEQLSSVQLVSTFMHSKWGWPICETLHFIGLSMLVGAIGTFDLRLLGLARRIPIGALHRLIPWGVAGYVLNVMTGLMFLVTDPSEYIFNSAFHFKMLFMGVAGLNILMFYTLVFRRVVALAPGQDVPRLGRVVGAVSLVMWIGVIVSGRMLTFYRPGICGPAGGGFLASCIPFN